jgi:hypothetical protein
MNEDYDDYDYDLGYTQQSDEDYQERKEEQSDEGEEGEFIFFGIFSGFFDWLFK